jgi:hypothetical protein
MLEIIKEFYTCLNFTFKRPAKGREVPDRLGSCLALSAHSGKAKTKNLALSGSDRWSQGRRLEKP